MWLPRLQSKASRNEPAPSDVKDGALYDTSQLICNGKTRGKQ
jgi:hypothetical protein